MALTGADQRRAHDHAPVGAERHFRALKADATRDLDECADTDAASFVVGFCVPSAGRESRPVGSRDDFGEHSWKITRVVDGAGGRGVGKRLRSNQIAAAHVDRVEFQFFRCRLDQAFHEIGGFGSAGATIGRGGHGVGQDAIDLGAQGRYAIGSGKAA